jgi:hypothetical protein
MLPRVINLGSASVLLALALTTSSCGDGTAPPKPTKLVFVTEPAGVAETMVPLTTQPVVQTVDASGHTAGSSTTVTVDVIGSTGVVAAGGTATTNSTGLASFSGLTLGAINGAVGSVTLQFSAPNLEPVTKTIDLHCAVLPLTTAQTVSRAVTLGDCTFSGGVHHNMFGLMTADPVTAVRLTEDGALPGALQFRGPNEHLYFWGYGVGPSQPDNKVSFKVLLPAGRTLVAVSLLQNALGNYTLTTAPASADLTCETTAASAASPITSAQQLMTGDCVANSFLQDILFIGLPPNASVTATMSSAAFDPQIKLLNAFTAALITSSTAQGSTSVTFTNSDAPTPYYLLLTSSVAGASGPYNLTLNITYPSQSAVRAAIMVPSVDARVPLPKDRGAPRFAVSLLPSDR